MVKCMWNAMLAALPAVSNAKTRTNIDYIQTNRGRRLVERIAWKRACSQKSMAESIAAQHAEERINQRLNREAAAMIDSTNQWYVETIRKPLLDYKLFPQRLQFSTTDKTLNGLALQTGRFQLAAHTQPPEPVQPCDLALRVHESMLNNMAVTALAGLLFREDAVLTFLENLGVPEEERERFQSPPGELPWRIDFSRLPSPPSQVVQPVGFTIADGGFVVTVRGRRYIRGNQMRANMDVRAEYKIERTENGFKAVRKELGVTRRDGGFAGAAGTVLERWFGDLFDEEILLEDMDVPGEWSQAPATESDHGQPDQRKTIKMKTIQCVCQDGWLVLAWRRAAADRPAAPAK